MAPSPGLRGPARHKFNYSKNKRGPTPCRKAKIELSTVTESESNLPFIAAGASGPKHLNTKLARVKFAQLVKDILQRAVALTRRARQHAGLKPGDLPWVQRLIYLPDFG
jgi:molecular chaperone DnaK (HSP70)